MKTLWMPALLALAFSLSACGSKDGGEKAAPKLKVSAADKAAARKIYAERCTTCHGEGGKGDGAGAQALNPKPRSFTDAAWQKKTTDDALRKVIVGGGPAVGMSPLMPPNADLKDKPGVVNGLILKVRGFGG
jgi:mono/diheme cytochrome c family protein